jgi:hypothetical protein
MKRKDLPQRSHAPDGMCLLVTPILAISLLAGVQIKGLSYPALCVQGQGQSVFADVDGLVGFLFLEVEEAGS